MIVTVTQYLFSRYMKCRFIPRPTLERLQTCRRAVFDFRGKIKLLWIFSCLSAKEKYFGIFIEIPFMCLGLPCMLDKEFTTDHSEI